jgi:AcrR family transcriptional regulator
MPKAVELSRSESRSRPDDLQTTRAEILRAALAVFAEKGFDGARVDDIAARAQTAKPTIYYHYRSKADLYVAALEDAYAGMRDMEVSLRLDLSDPVDAITRLVEASFDYHADHPEWVRLVSIENLHLGRHVVGKPNWERRHEPILELLRAVLHAGEDLGIFRTGVDPLHLHWLISAMCFHRVANRYTWQANFGIDLADAAHRDAQRIVTVESVLRFLAVDRPAKAA